MEASGFAQLKENYSKNIFSQKVNINNIEVV